MAGLCVCFRLLVHPLPRSIFSPSPPPPCPAAPPPPPTPPDSPNASKKRQRAVQAASKEGKRDGHSVKAMMVVRRLSVGVRGSSWYRQAQGQQQLIRVGAVQGGRRLSSSTFQESNNQKEAVSLPTYWGQQWQKVKELGPVLLVFLTAGAAIWEGSRQVEKLRSESSMKEATLLLQMEKLRGEMKEKEEKLRGEVKELRGEVKEKEALLRGEFNKEDALRGGEVDRTVLDFLTRGDYGRTRELVEEQKKAWVAGLSPPPPPPPST